MSSPISLFEAMASQGYVVVCRAFRVQRPGGVLLAGFSNPAVYLFDCELADRECILHVKYSLT